MGALPGIALLLLGTLAFAIPMVGLAEASVRSGVVRYGSAYVAKLAGESLGPAGSSVYTPASFGVCVVGVVAVVCAMTQTTACRTAWHHRGR